MIKLEKLNNLFYFDGDKTIASEVYAPNLEEADKWTIISEDDALTLKESWLQEFMVRSRNRLTQVPIDLSEIE